MVVTFSKGREKCSRSKEMVPQTIPVCRNYSASFAGFCCCWGAIIDTLSSARSGSDIFLGGKCQK